MSGAKNCPETPRQRMIGMMYLVLTAMLALNVSSEILNGFTMVDNSLHTTIESAELRNVNLYSDFDDLNKKNPKKVHDWLEKANKIKKESDDLYAYIENFKYQIVKLADADDADPKVRDIKSKDNLDKAEEYAIVKGNGKILKKKIENYRNLLTSFTANDPKKQKMYQLVFSTNSLRSPETKEVKPWEMAMFEMMPVSAVVTLLTKYQSDIRAAESETVQYLKSQTDVSDFRVNKITAYVVPNSKYVIRGGRYSAQVVLSAVDSTKTPAFFIGGSQIKNGFYDVSCGKTGSFNYAGEVRLTGNDGNVRSFRFNGDYIVGEPSATVSNEDLNVVYKGIDNKFSISVPGVASENVSVSVKGGSCVKIANGRFVIRPTQDGEINISVFGKIDGKQLQMGGGSYRVKYLPDPKSFLQYSDNGGVPRLIQDGNLTKRVLKEGVTIIASYGQDELVKANFSVISFTLQSPSGNADNSGSRFNARQLSIIDKLEGGDFLTIKNIKAVGPDGKVRNLSPIQISI